jgi:hypothetical protein
MTYARITKLACGLLAAAALTACGGGGDKGPAWAQETKANLAKVHPYVKAPPAFLEECIGVGTNLSYRRSIEVLSDDGSTIVLRPTIRYYKDEECADKARAFTIYLQKDTMTVDGTIVEAISGETARKVTHNFPTGEVIITADLDGVTVGPTPGDEANSITVSISGGQTLELERIQTGESYHDIFLIKDGFLYFGDLTPVYQDPNDYPTDFDLDTGIYEYTVI